MTKEKRRAEIPMALAVNTVAFALGAVGGFCLAGWLSSRGWLSFDYWLESYAMGLSIQGMEGVSFWAVLWDALRWPLLVLLLGYTALGVWMIPMMFALRGLFLCFCVAALSEAGRGGFLLVLVLLGVGGLIKLPTFFLLGVHSWIQAAGQRGRLLALPADWGSRYLARSALILGCVAGCAWIECLTVPGILRGLAPLLTATG